MVKPVTKVQQKYKGTRKILRLPLRAKVNISKKIGKAECREYDKFILGCHFRSVYTSRYSR